jgi:hypothetical protein
MAVFPTTRDKQARKKQALDEEEKETGGLKADVEFHR